LRQRIERYIASNQAVPARAALESLLARDPGDTAARLMLGGLYAAEGRLRDATGQTLLAAGNPPADAGLLEDLIGVLIKVGEIVEARRLLSLPVIAGNESVQVLMRAASQWQMAGDHQAALALLEKARAAGADDRIFHFCYATQLAFNGDQAAAAVELQECIALDPPLGNAYVQLAHLRTQTADDNHLTAIETALGQVETGSEDCAALEFARYKELEDLHRY
jgi:Flp pilus assembly protein TadD